jgi:hypothetical protein
MFKKPSREFLKGILDHIVFAEVISDYGPVLSQHAQTGEELYF